MNYRKIKQEVDRAAYAEEQSEAIQKCIDRFFCGSLSIKTGPNVDVCISFDRMHTSDIKLGYIPLHILQHSLSTLLHDAKDYYDGVQRATAHSIKGGRYD